MARVISLSFANVKNADYQSAVTRICQLLTDLYRRNRFLLKGDLLSEKEKEEYENISKDMPEVVAAMAIYKMSEYLFRCYGRKVVILLDEYDTPLQEAYVNGYWKELVCFIRGLFNAAFKTNPYLDRAIMTGITRISRESVFSDLNNLEVVTTTSEKYETSFGFMQQEVTESLEEYGLSEREEEAKAWYDGFTFGKRNDIYNPWSILNFLDKGKIALYWVNTSSNRLVGRLIQEGSPDVKMVMEDLLKGKVYHTLLDEQIVYDQLDRRRSAVWSLLLASGYLKVQYFTFDEILSCSKILTVGSLADKLSTPVIEISLGSSRPKIVNAISPTVFTIERGSFTKEAKYFAHDASAYGVPRCGAAKKIASETPRSGSNLIIEENLLLLALSFAPAAGYFFSSASKRTSPELETKSLAKIPPIL